MHDASKKPRSEGGHIIFGHQPGFLPAWLTGEEIYIVIASGMGSPALFNENHIEAVA